MRLLLDTHALLWFADGSPRLSKTDRILVTQCRLDNLSIISADEVLDAYQIRPLW